MKSSILSLFLMLLLTAPATAQPREFRAFAVAYKHELARSESYASFRAAIRQQFVRDIAPRLRADADNLVSYPENQTLMAYLVGLRGEAARTILEDAGAIAGLASLAVPYAPQIAYYEARFPGTLAPGQLLQLALTDTLARLVFETFAPLADEFDIYLSVSSNLARFERIQGPEAALLADPEADSSYAYRATSPEILNRNFVFGPDGQLLTAQDKAYLVPIERDQTAGLGLTGIETFELPVFDLPFARIGTVISKDAWMPDVNDRLDQLGAEVLIQPEAFSTWGIAGGDLWPPDKFQRGGWWMAQKHPAVRANVTPMLTGNLGDLTFDGQPLIVIEGGAALRCLMGQRPEPGWAAVGIWSDYSEPNALCDPARRAELEEQALAMQPGSADARENRYADDVVFTDISLPARAAPAPRVPGRGHASLPMATGPAALMPRLSAREDNIWLSWIDSFGQRRQSVTLSRWQGNSWEAPHDLGNTATRFDHFDNQWAPAPLALEDGTVLVAYTAFPTENWDLFASRITTAARVDVRVDDADSDGGVSRERGHSSPRLIDAGETGILAVWSDLRWPWIKPQARFAWSRDGGATWSASQRADGGPLEFEDAQLDARDPGETRGQAFPDALVLADGRLLFAWQEADHQGVPGIVVSRQSPSGEIEDIQRLSTGPAYRPRLAGGDDRQWLIYEARDEAGGLRLTWHARTSDGLWSEAKVLDRSADAGHRQRFAVPLIVADELLVVFEDDRAGDADILMMFAGAAAPVRVDDGPPGQDSFAPTAVIDPHGFLLIAWQQENDDGPQIRWTLGRAPPTPGRGGAVDWLVLLAMLLSARWRGHEAP